MSAETFSNTFFPNYSQENEISEGKHLHNKDFQTKKTKIKSKGSRSK